MARVLVLTDLTAEDGNWKGPIAWQIILSLVQSQHEVRVLTTQSNRAVPVSHPLLTVIQPVKSWRVDQFPRLFHSLMAFRPDVIQSFGFAPSNLWSAFSVWPALVHTARLMPRVRRVSSLFDEYDCRSRDASYDWHRNADVITVFSQRHQARMESRLSRTTQVLPLEPPPRNAVLADLNEIQSPQRVLIPAPVSEWQLTQNGLEMVKAFLRRYPECSIYIMGGWGSWSAGQRKAGWQILEPVASQIHIIEDLSWSRFQHELHAADTLWLESLAQESWRYLLALLLGRQENKRLFLPSEWTPSLTSGSTANSLSRLYSQ